MSDRSQDRGKDRGPRKGVPLRPLVQPREHGVYGLFAEPVLLGMLLAPSVAGAAIAVGGAAAVVAQQPATLALADLRRGRSYPRTRVAGAVAVALAAVALLAVLGAVRATGLRPPAGIVSAWWAPLLVALVPAGVQFAADRRLQGKTALAQTSGAVALSALAPAIALAGGAPAWLAWTAWAGLALRAVVSVPTVRTRLRLARAQPARQAPVRVAALVLPLAAMAAWTSGLVNAVPVAVAVALAVRVLWTVRASAPAVPASHVGIAETIVGLVWVAALAVGLQG